MAKPLMKDQVPQLTTTSFYLHLESSIPWDNGLGIGARPVDGPPGKKGQETKLQSGKSPRTKSVHGDRCICSHSREPEVGTGLKALVGNSCVSPFPWNHEFHLRARIQSKQRVCQNDWRIMMAMNQKLSSFLIASPRHHRTLVGELRGRPC